MNTVSFETAKALKEAGFPQPLPDVGQVWFWDNGEFLIVCFKNGCGVAFAFSDLESKIIGISFRGYQDLIFAPTATDILRELWFRFELSFGANGKWLIREITNLNTGDLIVQENDNPAEAAALAWLEQVNNMALL